MPTRVLIVDPTPAFRRGIGVALTDAKFVACEASSILEAGQSLDADILVATLRSAGDFAAIEDVADSGSQLRIVALVEHGDLGRVADAIRAGVVGVVDRDAAPEVVVDAIRAAIRDHTLVPDWAVAAVVARLPAPLPGEQLVSADEITWLRLLAGGTTVAALADQVAYSEREMFRSLHDLYERIGVHSRTEALLWADRHALLAADAAEEGVR